MTKGKKDEESAPAEVVFDPREIYRHLSSVDMTEHVEKTLKKHNYISWVEAIRTMMNEYGYEFQWQVHEDKDTGLPYFKTHWDGAMVKVSVYVNGHARTQWHPVITHTNTPIKAPDTMAINNAIQRCLAKCIALHGLGIYIYAGEDLPPTLDNPDRVPEAQDRPQDNEPPPPPVDDAVSRKAKVRKWIQAAINKGLTEEDTWLLWEASRVSVDLMEHDYWDVKNVTFDQFVELTNHFGAAVRENIERLKTQ